MGMILLFSVGPHLEECAGFRCFLWLTRKQWEPQEFLLSLPVGVYISYLLVKKKIENISYLQIFSTYWYDFIYFFSFPKENNFYVISWLIELLKTPLISEEMDFFIIKIKFFFKKIFEGKFGYFQIALSMLISKVLNF